MAKWLFSTQNEAPEKDPDLPVRITEGIEVDDARVFFRKTGRIA
jgi:hypothetical protein